jgi:uncharacterized protein (DUF2267 family)
VEYDRFIARVQQEAAIAEREVAVRGVVAVLATLGERLYRTESSHLAAQLPNELKPSLRAVRQPATSRATVPPFSLEEFYKRVSARADLGYPEAVTLARAVGAVLREAVAPGELADIRAELPPDFGQLFD